MGSVCWRRVTRQCPEMSEWVVWLSLIGFRKETKLFLEISALSFPKFLKYLPCEN